MSLIYMQATMNMSARPLPPQTSNISPQDFLDKVDQVTPFSLFWFFPPPFSCPIFRKRDSQLFIHHILSFHAQDDTRIWSGFEWAK